MASKNDKTLWGVHGGKTGRFVLRETGDKKAMKTVAEFFAGIGLMRMGLERAGWRVAFANDIDPGKKAMYTAHFTSANGDFTLDDIHKLKPESVPT